MDYQRPNHVETPEEQARVQHSEWQLLKIFVVVVVAIVLVAAISFGVQVNKSMRELTDPRPAAAAPALTSRPAAASKMLQRQLEHSLRDIPRNKETAAGACKYATSSFAFDSTTLHLHDRFCPLRTRRNAHSPRQ